MNFFAGLYQFLIGPLALFFEVVYSMAYRMIHNPGLAIVFLSLAMNFLVLPLYKKADAMQAEERETELKLEKWTKHIKKAFTGDERFMILQTYYRQNNYKPTYALKGSLSLLLEIPFFIAAYQFLSHLEALRGVSFGPIRDLGAPDAMFTIAGFTINVLPILMTLINVVSSMIYTKGLSLKSKIQLYVMALAFLVFLYQSPAGLVFYWTLNNLFSLVKNIFYKLKNPKLVLSILFSGASVALLGFILFIHPMDSLRHQIWAIGLILLLNLPLLLYFVLRRLPKKEAPVITKKETSLFRLGCVFLTLLLGVLIPSAVIRSSPQEFTDVFHYQSPLWHVFGTFLLAAGTFLVWFQVFYSLAEPKGKKIMSVVTAVACVGAVINYLAFGTNLGNMSPKLVFNNHVIYSSAQEFINLAVLLAAAVAVVLVLRWKKEIVHVLILSGCVALVAMTAVNVVQINTTLSKSEKVNVGDEPGFTLSRNGKNVVVIMLDRAISSYLPYCFEENPILKEQFAGFTYYPNTTSFGQFTNFGTPALFGGYEYAPEKLNDRSDELLVEKHNEALKVMPVLFLENGYKVSVCDPTYANYQWVPDLSIYDDYPDIRVSITEGRFMEGSETDQENATEIFRRNFFCFSVFKTSPVLFQTALYAGGSYNHADTVIARDSLGETGSAELIRYQEIDKNNLSISVGRNEAFMEAYTTLARITDLTEIQEGTDNCFAVMSNNTTHDPMLLQEPAYEPAALVDNREYDAEHAVRTDWDGNEITLSTEIQVTHYHANMASFLKLGEWLDYLREEGVYDNTRIIIVSDHGRDIEQLEIYNRDEYLIDPASYHALFMVKDFDSDTFTVDNSFHLNADTPYYATKDLIENAANPFTGNAFSCAEAGKKYRLISSDKWDVLENHGKTFLRAAWYSLHDYVFEPDNWHWLEEK